MQSTASTPSTRTERLRVHARTNPAPAIRSEEAQLLWYRSWIEAADEPSVIVRRARAKAAMLRMTTPVIDDDELIVGKPCYRELTAAEREELAAYRRDVDPTLPPYRGQGSHMAIDYEKLLAVGVSGIRAEVAERSAALSVTSTSVPDPVPGPDATGVVIPDDPIPVTPAESLEFYRACAIVLDGLIDLAARYAAHARLLARSADDEDRAAELETIAATLDRVPVGAARTFREAVQAAHFVTVWLEGLYQPGRPDRYLIDFYRRDLAAGTIDAAQACELIDSWCVLFNEYIPGSLAIGFMVGGSDASGADVANELTRLFLESIPRTRMIYPGIGLCCTPDTDDSLIELAARILAGSHSHPAIFNDRVIVEGLRSYGLPPEEACEYIHSTCVEITPVATSAVWVASPYINLVEPLLEILGVVPGGFDRSATGSPSGEWLCFDELVADYRIALKRRVDAAVVEQNRMQEERRRYGGDPLVSCFVRDCLERGRDVDWGGARHNWIMPSFVGMANLVDSLAAIRTLVFERGELDFYELVRMLEDDFDGYPGELETIRSEAPKYGNDIDEVDELALEVTGWIRELLSSHRTYRGDRFIPSLFCWVMHERLGRATPATPDGRRSGFPLGDGSGPAQGRELCGPTASILSSTKWDHRPFIGGIAVNLKLGSTAFPGGSTKPLEVLIRTYLERGGFELQVNVVDRDTLVAARTNPAEYADLVVRIGGYSDYFTRLSPAMQEEVILRTAHESW
jgi:trans-4-hydroxy-L-proline dehydratase